MRNIMSVLAAILLVITLAPPAAAQQRIDEKRAVASGGSVRLYNLEGRIRVTGWDHDTVAIRGTIAKKSRFFFAGGAAGVKAFVELPEETAGSQMSEFDIHVPTRSRVWIKTTSADIEISGVAGSIDVNSMSGRIQVTGTPRELYVESMDGDVLLDAAGSSLRVKTASGSITLRSGSEDVVLTTVSGTISVERGLFQRGRFESVTGDIRFAGSLDRAGTFTFDTHSGAVELRLDPKVSADLEITSFSGKIRNGFNDRRPRTVRGGRGQELVFTLGNGGSAVTVRNFKGAVVLTKGVVVLTKE
jgi:hypothetical protein